MTCLLNFCVIIAGTPHTGAVMLLTTYTRVPVNTLLGCLKSDIWCLLAKHV